MKRTLEPEVMDTVEEADEYAAMDHTDANNAFVGRLVELGARGQMLDIGTGPGDIPLLVCDHIEDAHIVAIDLAETMLTHAQEKLAASEHGDRVRFQLADAKGLGFPDESFDTVFSNTILHHIPKPEDLLREARRVLKPGGALLIRDLMRPETAERADELVDLHAADASPNQRELFRASLHAALTREELTALASECGLESAEIVVDSDRHLSLQLRRES